MLTCHCPQKSPCTGVYSAYTAQTLKAIPSIGFSENARTEHPRAFFISHKRIYHIRIEISVILDTGESVA